MSKKIKERTRELASKELAIKKKLLGEGGGFKSKASKIGKTALMGGVVAFILYALYKSFFHESKKPKKNKGVKSTSGIVMEKLMTFLLPYLGEILKNFLNKPKESKTEESEKKD